MNTDDGTVQGDVGETREDADETPGPTGTDDARAGSNARGGSDARGGSSALVSAVVGGLATVLLGFVPFSPVLGGALAGYLRRGNRRSGLRMGAAAGLVAAIPTFVGLVVLSLFVVAGPGGASAVRFLLLVVLGLTVISVYVVGLSIAGGYLGVAVRERQDEGRAQDTTDGGQERTDAHPPGAETSET